MTCPLLFAGRYWVAFINANVIFEKVLLLVTNCSYVGYIGSNSVKIIISDFFITASFLVWERHQWTV